MAVKTCQVRVDCTDFQRTLVLTPSLPVLAAPDLGRNDWERSLPPQVASALRDRLYWGWEPQALGVACLSCRTECGPLATLALTVMQDHGLFDSCAVEMLSALNFFTALEASYNNLPYHNAGHACDVLHVVHYILSASGAVSALRPHEVMAVLVAAAAHDVGHMGRNNAFHIATRSPLALRYNDVQVLENYHSATAFELMSRPAHNIAGGLDRQGEKTFRELVIRIILSTDIGVHAGFMSEAKQMLSSNQTSWLACSDQSVRWAALRLIVKCADVSNIAKSIPHALRWGLAIMTEFFAQGDEERSLGLAVSPGCDRHTADVRTSQVAFQDALATPMFQLLAAVLPSVGQPLLMQAQRTRDFFAGGRGE